MSKDSKLTGTSPLLLLVLVLYAAASATAAASVPAPSPAADDDISPAPSPAAADGNMDFLDACVEKFDQGCGMEVYHGVFRHTTVTKPCCQDLVRVGRQCHDGLVRRVIEAESRLGEVMVSRDLARSEEVWSDCVRLGVAPGRLLPAHGRQWLP